MFSKAVFNSWFSVKARFNAAYRGRVANKSHKYLIIKKIGIFMEKNKAGYTAISCGRVGRGGNATVRS